MRRIFKYISRHIVPVHETGEKAIGLRHEALLAYAVFLFLLQFGLHYISVKFPGILGFASNIATADIIGLTNSQRASKGLGQLIYSSSLSQAAQSKAEYMFAKNYWAHIAPDGTTPWFFIQKYNYKYLYAGENLAKDFQTSNDVVDAWMASTMGHRENILNPNYRDIGVAVVNGVLDGFETTLVVQMFGAEVPGSSAMASTNPSSQPKPSEVPAKPPQPTTTPVPAQVVPSPQITSTPVALNSPVVSNNTGFLAPGVTRQSGTASYMKSNNSQPLIPIVDVVSFGKSISYTFGFFLLGLFVLDGVVTVRKNIVRISGHSFAHIMVLVLLLATTWLLSPGTIR